MNCAAAEKLARELMDKHGLTGWRFRWTSNKARFGSANHALRIVALSRVLAELNSEDLVRDTILHEIAHALVPAKHGHDATWKAKAVEIGACPQARYGDEVTLPPAMYVAVCVGCGRKFFSNRRRTCSCGKCSRSFDENYILGWIPNPAYRGRVSGPKLSRFLPGQHLLFGETGTE